MSGDGAGYQWLASTTPSPAPTLRDNIEAAQRFLDDPYTQSFDVIRWKLRMEFGFGSAVTAPLAMMTNDLGALAPTGDGLEALGRMAEAASMRCEAAIRLFHRRPSWRGFWRCVKWGFLSGWRSDYERARNVREGTLRIERVSPWWALSIMARFGLPFGGRG